MIQGLSPLTKDTRDITVGALIDLPRPENIPDFMLEGGFADGKVQEADDCSAFAVTLARELRENIELDREFQFAAMKSQTGDPEAFGGNLRDAMSVPKKIGALPLSLRPLSCIGKPLDTLRYIGNWGDVVGLLKSAWNYRAKSYTFIEPTQGMDAFDTIIATMYYHKERGEKRAVVFGTFWNWSLSDYIIDRWTGQGTGHAMTYRGKVTVNGLKYIVVQQNYGLAAGEKGLHLFGREVVNESQKIFGAATFTSYTPEELRAMIEQGYKIDSDVRTNMVNSLLAFIRKLIALLK